MAVVFTKSDESFRHGNVFEQFKTGTVMAWWYLKSDKPLNTESDVQSLIEKCRPAIMQDMQKSINTRRKSHITDLRLEYVGKPESYVIYVKCAATFEADDSD